MPPITVVSCEPAVFVSCVPVTTQPEPTAAPLSICMGRDTICKACICEGIGIRHLRPSGIRHKVWFVPECLTRFAHRRCGNKIDRNSQQPTSCWLFVSILFLHRRRVGRVNSKRGSSGGNGGGRSNSGSSSGSSSSRGDGCNSTDATFAVKPGFAHERLARFAHRRHENKIDTNNQQLTSCWLSVSILFLHRRCGGRVSSAV